MYLLLEKNISVMKHHSKADTVVTAFGIFLCCQGRKLFSNYFRRLKKKRRRKEEPKICMLEDASKILYLNLFFYTGR